MKACDLKSGTKSNRDPSCRARLSEIGFLNWPPIRSSAHENRPGFALVSPSPFESSRPHFQMPNYSDYNHELSTPAMTEAAYFLALRASTAS
jgi:hypothetical protein